MTSVLQYLADYLKALLEVIRGAKRTHVNASHPTPFLLILGAGTHS
jgi:hypothetical protein